ncbi:MAG: tetratricopeptide repeat protein [Verrucomicrobia bacterium]|nr:tetratricopeptide repeat protein [Verrucomicrobiota bacterium]
MPNDGSEQRKLAAIMFTDMVGYSALAQRDEALALELLAESQRLLRTQFPLFNGREVKTTGDGFLVEFPSALQATQCAMEIQRAVVARNSTQPGERQIHVRIGIHVGDVVHREADMYGDGVNIAARIEPLAIGGGICLSDAVYGQVRNKLDAQMTKLDAPELKNIELPIDVYRVVLPWEEAKAKGKRQKEETGAAVGRGVPSSRAGALKSAAVVAVVLLAVGVGWWLVPKRGSSTNAAPVAVRSVAPGRIMSLAVKPLDDFSGDTNNAYLSDGMTEALCAALGNVSALRVPGRSSVMRFKGGQKSISEMAKELNVEAVVEGSSQRAGSRMMITVQLIDAATDRHLWATNYQRDLSDFFVVQSEVARAIATEVQARLTPEDQARLARARPANPEVMEACLLGIHYWWQPSEEGITNGLRYFEKAIGIDPSYAPAHAGKALIYEIAAEWKFWPARLAMPKARQAAQKAIEFDPMFADGYSAMGVVQADFDWDWASAEKSFRRALELNPNSSLMLDSYAWFLAGRGRFEEAITLMKRALEVDPLGNGLHDDLGNIYHNAGQFERALTEFARALELNPKDSGPRAKRAATYRELGRTAESLAECEAALRIDPDSASARATYGYGLGIAGRRDEALKVLADLDRLSEKRYVSRFDQAKIYLGLGQKDVAMDWYEKAYNERDPAMSYLRVDPVTASLRNEPRFQALVKTVENGGKEK